MQAIGWNTSTEATARYSQRAAILWGSGPSCWAVDRLMPNSRVGRCNTSACSASNGLKINNLH